jgi:hypothetical protein
MAECYASERRVGCVFEILLQNFTNEREAVIIGFFEAYWHYLVAGGSVKTVE